MVYDISKMSIMEAREIILKDAPTEKVRLLVSLAITAYFAIKCISEDDINNRDRVMSIASRDDGDNLDDFLISDVNDAIKYVNSINCDVLAKYIYIMFGATAMLRYPYPHMYD